MHTNLRQPSLWNLIRLALGSEGDTSGIGKYIYDDEDRLIWRKAFHVEEGRPVLKHSYESTFSVDGREDHVITHYPDGSDRFFYRYEYDPEAKLIAKHFTEDGEGEQEIYEYEDVKDQGNALVRLQRSPKFSLLPCLQV